MEVKGYTKASNEKYLVRINLKGRRKYLGYYDTEEEAAEVYKAALKRWGKIAGRKRNPATQLPDEVLDAECAKDDLATVNRKLDYLNKLVRALQSEIRDIRVELDAI